jgi:Carboxypeptidase regulatory-like domain
MKIIMEENGMKKAIIIPLALWCSAAAIAQVRTGEVHGFVVDPQGNPVAGATVRCDSTGAGPVLKSAPQAQTDQNGQFTLSNLALGGYSLRAMKEEDGYPNPFWSFYNPRQAVSVNLTSDAPEAGSIRLMLEPKAAVVTGTVSDAVTGEPLSAIIHMWRADSEIDYVDQGVLGKYRILIPADTAVRISVRSPGHQEWFNGGAREASRTASMVISAGHSQELQVKLARTAQ